MLLPKTCLPHVRPIHYLTGLKQQYAIYFTSTTIITTLTSIASNMSSSSNKSNRPPSFSSKTGSSSHNPGFTNEMQDRQARNKDPATGVSYGALDDEEGRAAPSRNSGRSSKKPSRYVSVFCDSKSLMN